MMDGPNRFSDGGTRGALTILVIDDDEDLRFLVHEVLERAGYRVLEAGNGIDGLELATRQSPDLFLVDLIMPRMDGLEVLQRLRSNETVPPARAILLSARSDNEIIRCSTELGARFLAKPFNPPQLVALVNACFAVEPQIGGFSDESI